VDLRTLVPLDEASILESVRKTGRLVMLHEATRTGGFGGEIAALAGLIWIIRPKGGYNDV